MATATIIRGATAVGSPSSGDSLFVLGGNAAIVTDVNQSGLADGLVVVEVSREYFGEFATAANPFYVEVTSRLFYLASGGNMYYRGKDATDATPLILVAGGGHFHAVTDGTATRFEVHSGEATISGPFIATTLRASGGRIQLLDDTSTDPTLIHLVRGHGARLKTERGATTMTLEWGEAVIDAGSNTIGTINALGADIRLLSSGTITTANLHSSIIDLSRLTAPITITNTNINMALPGAQAFLDHPLITFTNAATRYCGDGRPL